MLYSSLIHRGNKVGVKHIKGAQRVLDINAVYFLFLLKPGRGCGAAGASRQPGPGFWFPLKWWDSPPPPHQVTWGQPINMRLARKREPIRGKLKSPQMPKFEKAREGLRQ